MTAKHFSEMQIPRPEFDQIKESYDVLASKFQNADNPSSLNDLVVEWDNQRRLFGTWVSLAHLRFAQDTKNEDFKSEREYADELVPKVTELEVEMKRKLIAKQDDLATTWGDHVFALWASDILTYEPAIQDDLVKESKLCAEYNELLASAEIEFEGETHNLSSLGKYYSDADRSIREAAVRAKWDWMAEQSDALDRIYDELVGLRTKMARELGHDNYIPLGYERMQRIDYNAEDVENFRQQVIDHVVPLATKLREQQRERLGVDTMKVWDEPVSDPSGNPKPNGEPEDLVEAAKKMFDEMHPEIGEFFRLMDEQELLDLVARPGKSGGGFCTSFPEFGVPFIFANFNGTKGDVEVFTHEMGHAFQNYASRNHKLVDLHWPTMESAEIHSMSLEFLTWPQMDKFFGDEAERFRRIHLTESLLFIPYGCAVDHYQHEIYANPDMTPDERNATWKRIEAIYQPGKDWGGIEHGEKGGRWQGQMHIYGGPFYYIDYVLAMTCALQFWEAMQSDYEGSLDRYVTLCRRGGEAPFQALAKSAGLVSPFEPGCLEKVVARANEYLV